tara:strand:+ start:6249 stop:7043 length:795 start_codon:yes stop_codon:yes gene_type:complete
MKIAYTMQGMIGGFNPKQRNSESVVTKDDQILIFKYICDTINKNILQHNDIDIFIFSWHTEFEKEFTENLSPTRMKLEKQIDFKIPDHLKHGHINRVFSSKSRWYGFQEVIKLVNDYEEDHNFKYDLVINARLDLCWNKPYKFNELDTTKFHIPYQLDNLKWGWPYQKDEIVDHIFATNSTWMQQYSSMFDLLDEYTLPGQCPQWNTISNHFLMVWHLRKLGLLDEQTVSKTFTTMVNSWNPDADYEFFRFRDLTRENIIKSLS